VRPADTVETAVAWTDAVAADRPSTLIFSRQNLAFNPRTDAQIANIEKRRLRAEGWDDEIVARKIILIATGSEVELAMKAVEPLAQKASRRASCRCRRPTCSTARTPSTASACCRTACAAWRSKRA
jgi:transketolase